MKYKTTANRLREAMSDKNIKAHALSEKTEVSRASISQYMNGSHAPSNLSAGKLAKALGVNPVWLMGFDVPKHNDTDIIVETYNNLSDEAKKQALDFIMFLGGKENEKSE